ncbi:DMT family transporter [Rhizobium halophytocola]|uniref:Transporter family-2 protein n=1 Tax=Rhizobium halophytocola TaxID=735519 RepID=A0ABS4DVS4_9HYPH|nr:DMT family transporter [Rhizobium halophytocola]MBP1849796.1 transporter family-2 protein [Rhizobium halophytocola]
MLFVLVTILVLGGGIALAVQSSINGRLGARAGILETAWLTFVVGAAISFLLYFFFEPPHDMTLFSAPKWQLIGALFGVVYILVSVFAVPKIGIAAATVAVITGQLLMSLLIDNFGWLDNARIPLDPGRCIAIVLLAGAVGLIYLGNRKAS